MVVNHLASNAQMTRTRPNRLLRNNSNSVQNLNDFYERHIQYLNREKSRVELFLKENNIKGNDLESKLEKLQNIIDEAKEQKERIKRYQNTQTIVSSIINQINQEKEEFKQKINELTNENEELQRQILTLNNDLFDERALNERIIANQQTQIDNLETREEISASLYLRYCTTSRLRRIDVFFTEDNDEM